MVKGKDAQRPNSHASYIVCEIRISVSQIIEHSVTKVAYYVIFEECTHPCMISSFLQPLATEEEEYVMFVYY